jgi:hypothetical protein
MEDQSDGFPSIAGDQRIFFFTPEAAVQGWTLFDAMPWRVAT